MTDSFAVHIGGGLYLNSGGQFVFGPPNNAQVYEAPAGLKLDAKKLADTFKDLSGLLPGKDDVEKWVGYGVPRDVVNFLASLQGTVKVIGTAASIYFWAIGAALTIMELIASDDEGLSPELAKALYGIKSQLSGVEEIARADSMIAMHAQLEGRIDRVQGLLRRLVVEEPAGLARAAIFGQMRDIVDELSVPLAQIRNQEWATTFNADANKGRGFLSYRLFSPKSDGTVPNVPMVPPGNTRLDYRLGVPMLAFTATTYASLLKVAMPWFRSSGMYAAQLRKTAAAIDRFVVRTQDECLARTLYTGQTVFEEQGWSVFEIPVGGGPRLGMTRPGVVYPMAVGAFDLVRYDDFFLAQRFIEQFQAGQATGPRGLFNYAWMPPQTAFLDQVAAAANAQAEEDYTKLQVTTGLLHLAAVARMLRFLSTPPRRSETVEGRSREARSKVGESPTTATSPSIVPIGVISQDATRTTFRASATVRAQTQAPGYVPQFRYRVVLRTLKHMAGNAGGWHELDYAGDVWSAEYVPATGDAANKRMRAEFRNNWVADEVVLHAGPAPARPLHGTSTVTASTFDWYVPVGSPWATQRLDDDSLTAARVGALRRATGGASPHLAEAVLQRLAADDPAAAQVLGCLGNVRGGSAPRLDVRPRTHEQHVDAVRGQALPDQRSANVRLLLAPIEDVFDPSIGLNYGMLQAERRHVADASVTLDWTLTWVDGDLTVQLTGRPDQRPFRAYVVVEEVVYSGESVAADLATLPAEGELTEVLHTPFAVELVNQLVYVPREFFDREHRALVDAAKRWAEFVHHFAESREPKPGDPIEFLAPDAASILDRSGSTAAVAEKLTAYARFAEQVAPELWAASERSM